MSIRDVWRPSRIFYFYEIISSFILILIVFTSVYLFPCEGVLVNNSENDSLIVNSQYKRVASNRQSRLIKRSSGKKCYNSSDCASDLPGSICMENSCTCPQGFLPNKDKAVGCFQIGKHVGDFCNISAQCGEELSCRNHVCLCPEGFQLLHTQGANLCLFWQRPSRLVDRCHRNEDCTSLDANSVCKKRWCQCNVGYQLFETFLLGRKHKCFKTYKLQCVNFTQCSKFADTSDQFCICQFGHCHCIPNINFTFLDVYSWPHDKPNWYQQWKKDLILATRLLFITVILFFVPCFIYVTLGVRERSRQLFSQFVQPSRSPAVHYIQRRASHLRSMRSYRAPPETSTANNILANELHHVEISLRPNGVNTRLIDSRSRMPLQPPNFDVSRDASRSQDSESDAKEEDPPPSYDEIMRNDIIHEVPPPPYREL